MNESGLQHGRPLFSNSRRLARLRHRQGFTLLELLVALTIFAIMAAAIYSSLAMVLTTSSRLDEAGKSLKELQRTMLLLSRDLEQIINRPVRGGYDAELPPLLWPGSEEQLEMTSGGRSNPLRQPRCSLQRVAYRVRDGKLERLTWAVLDQAQDSAPYIQPLLSGVSAFELSFLVGKERTYPDWPPALPPTELPPLPRAVMVVMEVEGWGRLERIFPLAGGV